MNIDEAYLILEISKDISDDELKKTYKKLARKYHPDIYKDDPEKFKQINEAYQLITDFREHPEKYQPKPSQGGFWSNVVDLGEIFFNRGDFFRQSSEESVSFRATNINIKINLSFHESVLGCTKEISYNRNIKCKFCNAQGMKHIGNGCASCDGFGIVTTNNKGMIFQTICSKCNGKGVKKEKCEKCKGKRILEDKRTGNISVPPGSTNGDKLRLAGEGHFVKTHFFDVYSDVNIQLIIEPYKDMVMNGNNILTKCKISLLEALEGTTKVIETVYGNKDITIPPQSRHSDEIKIPTCGVKGTDGVHIVYLNVEYPNDVSKIIEVLKDNTHNPTIN